jgi:cell division protease FtsH
MLKTTNRKNNKPNQPKISFGWIILIIGLIYLFYNSIGPATKIPEKMSYSKFYELLINNKTNPQIKSVDLFTDQDEALMELYSGKQYRINITSHDQDLIRALRENVSNFNIQPPKTWVSVIASLLPTLVFVGLLWLLFYRGNAQTGGRIWSFGKSRARQISEDKLQISFKDVAGVDEAKEELQEVIEFLKDPKRFQRLGGKIPKGVLLMGPPGTGKTLLAKAVSGEAGVPFLSISGSDFVEMFVGVGASRVRDLFDQAKKSAKTGGRGCIIFIDEIDAVGRMRFAGIGGGHDEREQTLNALLVEMDGFNTQEGVILIAATNRPDVLDPALLRPGRFDRQIVINRPDIVGREAILKVHTRNIKLAKEVDLKSIARQTSGFSGADLANLTNEAALLAARNNKEAVGMEELGAAIERVIAGPEKKSRVINAYEKSIVAYHESGHALMSLLIPGADPLHKVSIIPRGMALGYTMQMPLEDRYIVTKKELLGKLTGLLGGRASEELIFNETTTGAQNDLEVATQIARKMVCDFGMSEKLGNLTLGRREGPIFLGRDIIEERNYSDQTARLIDEEIRQIIDQCYQKAKEELTKNKDKLKILADTLLEKEVLDADEVKKILGFVNEPKVG